MMPRNSKKPECKESDPRHALQAPVETGEGPGIIRNDRGEEEEERYLNPNAPRLPQNFGSPCSFRKALCSAFIKAMDSTRVLAGIVFFLIFNFYFSGVGSFW